DLPRGLGGLLVGAAAAAAQLRRDDLLDEADLPVGGGLDRAQVPHLEAVVAEGGRGPRDGEGVALVVRADPADQAVLLEPGEEGLVDAGAVEELAARQPDGGVLGGGVGGHERAGAPRLRDGLRDGLLEGRDALAAVARLQVVADDPKRKVVVALGGEDEPEPLHVGVGELAVAGRAALRLDEPLGLQEPDLGDRDVGELGPEQAEDVPDRHQGPGWLRVQGPSHRRATSCPAAPVSRARGWSGTPAGTCRSAPRRRWTGPPGRSAAG